MWAGQLFVDSNWRELFRHRPQEVGKPVMESAERCEDAKFGLGWQMAQRGCLCIGLDSISARFKDCASAALNCQGSLLHLLMQSVSWNLRQWVHTAESLKGKRAFATIERIVVWKSRVLEVYLWLQIIEPLKMDGVIPTMTPFCCSFGLPRHDPRHLQYGPLLLAPRGHLSRSRGVPNERGAEVESNHAETMGGIRDLPISFPLVLEAPSTARGW